MSVNKCSRMPELILLSDYDDWENYLEALYVEYKNDFYENETYHHSKPVKTFTELEYNLMQTTFNHITTKGGNDRLYNETRCQKIKWIKAILEGFCGECDDIRDFLDLDWQKKNKRFIIWCIPFDFVIILEERGNSFF